MDSREMDKNVKVVVWSNNNNVMKKIKLIFANYPQRDSNLHLDPLSKEMYSETERGQRYIWTKPHWKILESIRSSLFVGFIHPLLPDRLSYGYRNLFNVLNNKY